MPLSNEDAAAGPRKRRKRSCDDPCFNLVGVSFIDASYSLLEESDATSSSLRLVFSSSAN